MSLVSGNLPSFGLIRSTEIVEKPVSHSVPDLIQVRLYLVSGPINERTKTSGKNSRKIDVGKIKRGILWH